MQTTEVPDFCWLHENKNWAFPLKFNIIMITLKFLSLSSCITFYFDSLFAYQAV